MTKKASNPLRIKCRSDGHINGKVCGSYMTVAELCGLRGDVTCHFQAKLVKPTPPPPPPGRHIKEGVQPLPPEPKIPENVVANSQYELVDNPVKVSKNYIQAYVCDDCNHAVRKYFRYGLMTGVNRLSVYNCCPKCGAPIEKLVLKSGKWVQEAITTGWFIFKHTEYRDVKFIVRDEVKHD